MSTREDMAQCQCRNESGYPILSAGQSAAVVNSPVDNSRNKNSALPWAVMAAAFGFLGFGGMITVALLKPWETEGRAIRAEVRGEFAEQLAAIHAEAKQAGDDAAIWKNRVVKLEAEVNANRRR